MATPTEIAVATYNMSWASANGHDCVKDSSPTECNFLLSNPRVDDKYFLWENAMKLLIKFLNEQNRKGIPCIVGLQEVNHSGQGQINTIDTIEQQLKKSYENKLIHEYHIVRGYDGREGAAIIYNKVLGRVKHERNYDKSFNYTKSTGKPSGTDRPLHMVYTDQGYLIVNTHFPHDSDRLTKFYDRLQCTIASFIQEHKIKQYRAIFVVGDFNTSMPQNPFKINQHTGVVNKIIDLKFNGSAPKSCCFGSLTFKGSHSKDYTRTGDLVYSTLQNSGNIEIYHGINGPGGRSIESDHQFVYQKYKYSSIPQNF